MSRTRVLAVLGLLVLAALVVSGISPYDSRDVADGSWFRSSSEFRCSS